MPDVQTDAAPDVSSLYGAPNALDPKITSGLADLQRRKISADTASEAHIEKTLDEDSAMMKHALSREGASANDIKPWNAEAEQRKTAYDPIEAFGSLGSVFALLASAFTHQPMENALNGAAAAMNAVKQGKTEEYQRAFEAWKQNTDLALKRHQLMHDEYVDANELLKTNLAAGRAKEIATAAKYGDMKKLFLIEHGLDEDKIKLETARDEGAIKIATARDRMLEDHAKIMMLFNMKDENGKPYYDVKNPGSPRSQQAFQKWRQITSEQEHFNSLTQEEGKAVEDLVLQGVPRVKAIEQVNKARGGGSASAAAAERKKAAAKEQLDSVVGQLDSAIKDVDTQIGGGMPVVGFLGLGERIGETVGNIVGATDQTAAYTFRTKIRLLQNEIPRMIAGTTRISAQERAHLDEIVSGIGTWTSAKQAKAALQEVKQILTKADASGPQKGDVEGGFRFKGGDPSDPNAWEKVS